MMERRLVSSRHLVVYVRPFSLLIALVAIAAGILPARATCPGGPLYSEIANNYPQYLAACTGSPSTCPEATPPTIVASSQPQEVTLSTQIPTDMAVVVVRWQAQVYNPATYTWDVLWEHASDETLPRTGPFTLTYGAPGLKESATHAFRVAWCDANGCTCWSQRSTSVTTTGFTNVAPNAPAATSYKVEDSFERPVTAFKCNSSGSNYGDGLGPDAVWADCQLGGTQPGPSIADNGHAAKFEPNSSATYETRYAEHRHTFTEAKVRVAEAVGSGIAYNFQVTARQHMAGAPIEVRSYNVKLLYKVRQCFTKPQLVIWRADEYGQASCDASGNPILPGAILIPDTSNPTGKCTAMPPLDQVDPATGTSYPVWLRLEVDDTNDVPPNPTLTATVAWGNCPSGQGIDSCDYVCRATRMDTGDPKDMSFLSGRQDRWGMGFHDKRYFVDLFRTGSEQ